MPVHAEQPVGVACRAKQSQIVLVGPRDREDTRALRRVLTRTYLPFATVISVDTGGGAGAGRGGRARRGEIGRRWRASCPG